MPRSPDTICHQGTIGLPCFGLEPTTLTCPFCRNNVTTRVLPRFKPMPNCETFCYASCCCLWEKNDVKHVCPNCNRVLGIYHYA